MCFLIRRIFCENYLKDDLRLTGIVASRNVYRDSRETRKEAALGRVSFFGMRKRMCQGSVSRTFFFPPAIHGARPLGATFMRFTNAGGGSIGSFRVREYRSIQVPPMTFRMCVHRSPAILKTILARASLLPRLSQTYKIKTFASRIRKKKIVSLFCVH